MKTIGIVGSRSRDATEDYFLTKSVFLAEYKPGDHIVSGGCPKGGDRFAEVISRELNIPICIHYPEWTKRGRGAGLYRNTFIAKDADVLIAVVAANRRGGTEDTIRKYLALGKNNLVLV